MQIKIKHPGTQRIFIHSAVTIICLLFLGISFLKLGSPFDWVPPAAIEVKLLVILIILLGSYPMYCYFKYRSWAKSNGIRIPTKINFMPSQLVLHYKEGPESFDYKALHLELIIRITQFRYAGKAYGNPKISLLTLRLSDAKTDQFFQEIDCAIELKGPYTGKDNYEFDIILMYIKHFGSFSYKFTYDCDFWGLVSGCPNLTFISSEPFEEAVEYKNILRDKIETKLLEGNDPN